MFRVLELKMETEVSETCLPNLKMLRRCFEIANINDRNKYPKKAILVSCSACCWSKITLITTNAASAAKLELRIVF